ncbi:microtubule-associated tumor suppressor 1 homolog isoform X3 [Astatotilapia calliptera]|uniref:microtubule-associated tumor suppressor 1 homolog isoform X3 n=1 Tax=Astatotilapia calliptera TaxID=8154 RepID=UPI000E41D4F0|nr:microtubule-associated tumor suppressor 1 homolog isoform X3 [Astatotilapia calliptera]
MSASEPANSVPVRGAGGMKLPLHSAGDHNGNAFPISSSSSSSSSSSCLGESSPESLRSLSGGRTDSPLDYDMFDVTLTTVKTVTLKSVVSDWAPEEERNPDNGDDGDDTSLGKSQTVTESNDNSVSVYLDANGDDYHQDSWNDNLTLARSLTGNGGLINEDVSSGSSNGRRRSSSPPDSDATEVPADDDDDDDDDEEEALFVSVSSDVDVQRSSAMIASSGGRSGDGVQVTEVEVGGPAVHCPPEPSTGRHADPPASEHLSEDTQMSTEDVKKTSSPPPEEAETGVVGSKPPPSQPDVSLAARPRPAPRSAASTAAKPPGPEAKRVSRVDLKTVRAKVGSRSAPSPPKPATQNKSAPSNGKRAVVRKEVQAGDGGKRQRSSAGPIKVAVIRAKSRNIKPNHRKAAGEPTVPQEKSLSVSRTLSTSTSSLGSEVAGEKRLNAPRKADRDVPDKYGKPDEGEAKCPSEECVEGQTEGSGEASVSAAAVEKPRTPTRKVSSKLGPSPRPQGRGTRADRGPSGPAPGSGTGPPGQGSPGPRQAQTDGSTLGKGGPSAGSGAPTTKSQSIPKPRSSAVCGPTAAKPTANQHPGSAGRPAAPTAASKLPVKGLPTSLSSSSFGSNENNGGASKVDKNNKPREAPGKTPSHTGSSSQTAASTGGNNQNLQLPPPDLIPDDVNANAPVAPVPPVPATNATNTATSGTAGPSTLGLKARTGPRSGPRAGSRLQGASRAGSHGGAVASDGTNGIKQNQSKEQAEKKNQAIAQLRKLLVQGNKRVEALATVIQHLFTEREETLKQKKELSQELANLRDELVASSQCCERLQKEKQEARVGFEEALTRLREQHREELAQLEERLTSFYQTEWDKVHQTYQEEADKCRVLMEKQVEELRSRQEVERKKQEVSHSQKMESLKQQYKASIEEMKTIHRSDLDTVEKSLQDTEASLSEKLSELTAEKEDLSEKLRAEEERRKRMLTDKNLKDSHTVYLEKELESLKVVLEIKNNQLHQKEKKLMEMDKLVETNVKLEECLKKVQQENEDYKARMDKHAALSKQLSSEQAILQQTLQKESKVNKRLSMENEELLWKLHNGDLLASPRRLSPTSPFSSPRNSASFTTAAPLSPR